MCFCNEKGSGLLRFFVLLGRSAFFLCLFAAPALPDTGDVLEKNAPEWNESEWYYTIGNARQFAEFRDWVNGGNSADATYKLTADIRLDSDDWTPIGVDYESTPKKYFTGVLSGDGHTVSGFKVIGSKFQFAGLFGYFGGSISDLGVTDFVVSVDAKNNARAGGLVGYNNKGSIANSYAMGRIAVSGPLNDDAGGLVGFNNKGSITDSYAVCNVTANFVPDPFSVNYVRAGGLVGNNESGVIASSYAAGRVTSYPDEAKAGGLVGKNASSPSKIQNCVFDIQGTGRTNAVGENKGPAPDIVGVPTRDGVWTNTDGVFSADRWVVRAGYYPQLRVFANAGTEAAREASALSVTPVFLTSRDSEAKDTASGVTGAFSIPKWTPPAPEEKIGLRWEIDPPDALRYEASGDLWKIFAARAGEVELIAKTSNAEKYFNEKHFKLNITQSFYEFGGEGGVFPIDAPRPESPRPGSGTDRNPVSPPAPASDKLGDAERKFNEEHGVRGVKIEFPKRGLEDPKGVGEQLGEKNPVIVGNPKVRRVALTPEDGAGLAKELKFSRLGEGCGVAMEIPLGPAADDGEIDLLPVRLTFTLSSRDLEEAGLFPSLIAGNAEAFLEKTAVVKFPVEGAERIPIRLNSLLKDILTVSRDESPENSGGARVSLPYLLADAPGAPKLVRDGKTTRLVLFDGLKNGCLRDPIWLYHMTKKAGDTESENAKPAAFVVFPNSVFVPKDESREVAAFVFGLEAEREIEWRVEDGTVASIEKAETESELDIWVVKGLESGCTKITASVISPADAAPLSASLSITVSPNTSVSEAAEPRRGGCNIGATALAFGLAGWGLRKR